MKSLKANIILFIKDVIQLNFTVFTSLFGTVKNFYMPSADSQTCLVVPPTTTRNKVRAYTAVVESKTKIDEE